MSIKLLINKTAVCFCCKQLTFGFTAWISKDSLLCHQYSCSLLTPEAHYERTGIINSKYRKQALTKLLKGN